MPPRTLPTMVTARLLRIGASRLTVNLQAAGEAAVGLFHGCADETGIPTLVEASEALLTHPATSLVLDLTELEDAAPWCVHALARTIAEGHRLSKEVALVRCPAWLFKELRRQGTGGPVRHAGSLAAATGGALGRPERTLAVTLRSDPALVPRVGLVVTRFLAALGYLAPPVEAMAAAALATCRHAVAHRSHRGLRNQVNVAIHAEPDAIIVDVVDECDPPDERDPQSGWDDCVRQARAAVDCLDVFPDAQGTVWRLTRRVAANG